MPRKCSPFPAADAAMMRRSAARAARSRKWAFRGSRRRFSGWRFAFEKRNLFFGVNIMFAKIKRSAGMAAVAVSMAVAPVAANAQLPQAVQQAIEGGFTDAQSAMGWMIVGFAGLFAIRLVVRLINK